MHDTNLYSTTPNFKIVENLVDKLKNHLHISCTSAQYAVIFEKTKKFIILWTRKWSKAYGLIEEIEKGKYRRIETFEMQLKVRREAWLASQDPFYGPLEVCSPHLALAGFLIVSTRLRARKESQTRAVLSIHTNAKRHHRVKVMPTAGLAVILKPAHQVEMPLRKPVMQKFPVMKQA
jgi:hypothetical protein